jgi:hypothetical protein
LLSHHNASGGLRDQVIEDDGILATIDLHPINLAAELGAVLALSISYRRASIESSIVVTKVATKTAEVANTRRITGSSVNELQIEHMTKAGRCVYPLVYSIATYK